MKNIMIVDVETTGLDPKQCAIVEVAAVLYSIPDACIVTSFASLVHAASNEAEAINRIPVQALAHAPEQLYAWNRVGELVDRADDESVWMAHRAEFDRGFIQAAAPFLARRLPWVCSKFDVEWPEGKPGASCVEMALAHGVPVVSAHRALTDCMLIAGTLSAVQRAGHDLSALIDRAMRPRITVRAVVSYDDREQAKAAGFGWDGASKTWTKSIARDDWPMLAASWPFRTLEVVQA
jgi:DNA polymerase-3 subunit epsilon